MMAATRRGRRPRITPELINEYKRRIDPDTGRYYTDTKIAQIHGVIRQAISDTKRRYPGLVKKSPTERIEELWPWDVPSRFHRAPPYMRLRDHLRWRAERGAGLSKDRLALLQGFYDRLRRDNVVVEFDPTIPKHPGVFTGGWAFRDREESDGERIIRVNEYTKELSKEGEFVWRLPPIEPRTK